MNLTQTISHPQMPNIVTLSRLAAAFLIVIWMTLKPDGSFGVSVGTALIYLAAALTDILDGYLARKFNLVSFLGVFLDPLADKLLVSAALIMLIPLGRVLAWVVFLILAREIAITCLRAIAAERGLVISASESGKRKTLAQNIALFCLLWHYPLFWADTAGVGTVIIYVALVITYWSGFRYFYDFYQTLR